MNTSSMPDLQPLARFGLLLAAVSVALSGCSGVDKLGPPTDKKVETPAPFPIDLQMVSKEGFEQAVAKHKGKVVLVDFWATWCPPCVAQFPHTLGLAQRFKGKGLEVISVSVNKPEDIEIVRKFLSEKRADIENLITEYGGNAINEFDLDNGGVPCYWIYDREGKLAERISPGDPVKTFRPQMIDDAIERLLAAAPAETAAPATDAVLPGDSATPPQESPPGEEKKPSE
ncbi:MAG TPA: TlpA disulfide reductase family protein [Pirellulales bacterium]|jgi:thiol-disulfide isomerase/thioredoxin